MSENVGSVAEGCVYTKLSTLLFPALVLHPRQAERSEPPSTLLFNPQQPSDAVRKQKKKLEGLSSSVLSQFKQCHPSGNLKFNNLDIFQSLNLRF